MLNRSILKKGLFSYRSYHPSLKEYVKPATLSPLTYNKESVQYKILSNALTKWVPKHGFKEKAITDSLNELGFSSSLLSVIGASNSPAIFRSISPAVMELIKFQLVSKRYELTENLCPDTTPKNELPSLESLLLKRLEMDKAIGKQIPHLFAELATPSSFLFDVALPELHRLSDDMIYFSNEKDHHDMAWYTKRLGVSCAYVSSKLYMAQDNSRDFEDTLSFAKDKLHRIMKLGEYYNNTEEYAWYMFMVSTNLVRARLARS
ncbi:hypothetical protein NCAS_0E02870 [Naumovozyma castellii]|uniref:Ubiquinone biosynthesis protein n=1 Tax=Naumovozyma castellii TaxID=27288 RepID=G0VFU0_NAUCA|nr:hypothetical protein NCAS_0E02870 [Naumovozyma castellii CBS 4309]CCC70357.1 hypothetical protein NCAS_0E02870 [Naumovozyma castellii CBS 4309]